MARYWKWRVDMDYYDFLRENKFYKEDDPVSIFDNLTLNYIEGRKDV